MKAWLQLMRLPNVFTAAADVMMGYLVTHGTLRPASHFALLAAASCLLYLSGMILNDVFDAEVDAKERPERPIPSGRITHRAAAAMIQGCRLQRGCGTDAYRDSLTRIGDRAVAQPVHVAQGEAARIQGLARADDNAPLVRVEAHHVERLAAG